jgi:hypothetical protein
MASLAWGGSNEPYLCLSGNCRSVPYIRVRRGGRIRIQLLRARDPSNSGRVSEADRSAVPSRPLRSTADNLLALHEGRCVQHEEHGTHLGRSSDRPEAHVGGCTHPAIVPHNSPIDVPQSSRILTRTGGYNPNIHITVLRKKARCMIPTYGDH